MLAWLLVVIWLVPWYFLFRIAPRKPSLRQFAPKVSGKLSVIIPARNEAEMIERCVRSILRSTYAPLELIVVDDRSTDATAAIVEGLAREDARVRLVRGAELPEGWYGKPWACVQGYRESTGDILCFTDADTTHGPELHTRSVGAMEGLDATLFTVMSTQEVHTWSERLILPQFFFLLAAKFEPATLNRATRPKDAVANGQYIMMTRAAYEAVGTHERVKHEVAEDLALGQEVMMSGKKLRMVYALEDMTTRMYTGWAHLREGFSKNLFMGSRRALTEHPVAARIAPYFVGTAFAIWLVPPVTILLHVFGVSFWAFHPALVATISSTLVWMAFSIGIGIPPWWGLLYPLGALGAFEIAMLSAIRGPRRIEWKGRTYGRGNSTTNA